jgi:hypothetical protein
VTGAGDAVSTDGELVVAVGADRAAGCESPEQAASDEVNVIIDRQHAVTRSRPYRAPVLMAAL